MKLRLPDITRGVIVHQVNCLGYMGCGVALAIRTRFPQAYQAYQRFGHRTGNGTLRPGMCQIVRINADLAVANLAGQFGISRQHRMTDYSALETALAKLADRIEDQQVYFPYRMGCANAGGDWEIVRPLILRYFPNAKFFFK